MDHRLALVQGKFIGSLARIHVICLAAHWSPGCNSLPLQAVQLDKRAAGFSDLQQPGTLRGQLTYFKKNFTLSITDLLQDGRGRFSLSLVNVDPPRSGKAATRSADSNRGLITYRASVSD